MFGFSLSSFIESFLPPWYFITVNSLKSLMTCLQHSLLGSPSSLTALCPMTMWWQQWKITEAEQIQCSSEPCKIWNLYQTGQRRQYVYYSRACSLVCDTIRSEDVQIKTFYWDMLWILDQRRDFSSTLWAYNLAALYSFIHIHRFVPCTNVQGLQS